MKAQLIYLAGVPASGKSTLFRRLRAEFFGNAVEFKHGLLRGIETETNGKKLYMLGVFDGSTFEGTDRLSMAVINDALDWFEKIDPSATVFVEGDRLFNARFLQTTSARLMIIDASPAVLAQRHKKRGDSQTETFLRSRRTKVNNILNRFSGIKVWQNNTAAEFERNYHILKQFAKGGSNEVDKN